MRAVECFLGGGLIACAARRKKSLFHRMLCDVGAMRPRCAARWRKTAPRRAPAARMTPHCAAGDANKRLRTRSYCFFRFAGVNKM
jgi:hypothetical protein